MTPVRPQPDLVVPPEVVDPPPEGDQPVIPEPDPTHTPVIPEPDPTPTAPPRPAEPAPTAETHRRRETDESWPMIGTGIATDAMVKGAVTWGVVGALAGVAVSAIVALIPFAGLPYPGRFAIVGICAALAGATAGGLYGGGRRPELEDDVGNQIGPAPLLDKNVDPRFVRHATEEVRAEGSAREPTA
jgi:hypothetical protein